MQPSPNRDRECRRLTCTDVADVDVSVEHDGIVGHLRQDLAQIGNEHFAIAPVAVIAVPVQAELVAVDLPPRAGAVRVPWACSPSPDDATVWAIRPGFDLGQS